MERLWSPWRSQYISTFGSENEYKGCIFCDALRDNRDDERFVVHRGDHTFTIMNLYPYNSGHLLVVPNVHVDTLTAIPQEAYSEMMETVRQWITALHEVMRPQGFNIGTNLGRAGGAGIDSHVHTHIVPRWNGDVNFMPVIGETKVISEDLKETMFKLRKQYQKVLLTETV